jgi:hypothetical protein
MGMRWSVWSLEFCDWIYFCGIYREGTRHWITWMTKARFKCLIRYTLLPEITGSIKIGIFVSFQHSSTGLQFTVTHSLQLIGARRHEAYARMKTTQFIFDPLDQELLGVVERICHQLGIDGILKNDEFIGITSNDNNSTRGSYCSSTYLPRYLLDADEFPCGSHGSIDLAINQRNSQKRPLGPTSEAASSNLYDTKKMKGFHPDSEHLRVSSVIPETDIAKDTNTGRMDFPVGFPDSGYEGSGHVSLMGGLHTGRVSAGIDVYDTRIDIVSNAANSGTVLSRVAAAASAAADFIALIGQLAGMLPRPHDVSRATAAWIYIANLTSDNTKPNISAVAVAEPVDLDLQCKSIQFAYDDDFWIIRVPEVDEDDANGNPSLYRDITVAALFISRRLPGPDETNLKYFDKATKSAMIESLTKVYFGKALPPSAVEWRDSMESVESFKLFVFHGLGQAYLTAARSSASRRCLDVKYEVDLSFMNSFKVRDNFETYGGIAFFDAAKNPIGICFSTEPFELISPLQSDWVHAMARIRSSLIAAVTIEKHLIHTHLIVANCVDVGARESLPIHHPLRRLLKPHYFRTTSINRNAFHSLVEVNGIGYHLFAINEESYPAFLGACIKRFRYQTFPQYVTSTGLDREDVEELPFFKDGGVIWDIIQRNVAAYLKLFYKDGNVDRDPDINRYWGSCNGDPSKFYDLGPLTFDSLVDQITHSIFSITAGHQFYGGVVQYLLLPDVAPAKLVKKSNEADIETFILALCVVSLTGNPMALYCDDWSHLHAYLASDNNLHKNVIDVVGQLRQELVNLSDVIDSRNAVRVGFGRKPFDCCKPSLLESSVAK